MAFESLYFFLSITALLTTLGLMLGMLFFRITKRSIFGEEINSKHAAYKSMKSFSSNKNITITGILACIFVINLVYDITRLHNMDTNRDDIGVLLIAAPCVNIIMAIAIFFDVQRKFRGQKK